MDVEAETSVRLEIVQESDTESKIVFPPKKTISAQENALEELGKQALDHEDLTLRLSIPENCSKCRRCGDMMTPEQVHCSRCGNYNLCNEKEKTRRRQLGWLKR